MVQQGKCLGVVTLERAPTDNNVADIGCAFKNKATFLKFRAAVHQTQPDAPTVPYKREQARGRNKEA